MLRVVAANGSRLQTALEVLYSALPAADRSAQVIEALRASADGELDFRNLLLAEFENDPVGVLLLILDSGVGRLWPPVISSSLPASLSHDVIEDALLAATVRRLDAANAWIGQALLEAVPSRDHSALLRNGFTHLTDLRFFVLRLTDASSQTPQREPKDSQRLSYVCFRQAANRLRFANLIDRTYRGSLDCPELNGIRSGLQSLPQHEAAGAFSPDMWRLYRQGNEDVGVLLMVDRSDQRAWEIIYLGVADSARRHGVARTMLTDAIEAARAAGVERLQLMVDSRNTPAIRLYESAGFAVRKTNAAFVRLRPSEIGKPFQR